MSTEVLSVPGFRVLRDPDGSTRWEGDYRGMTVAAAVPFDGDSRCLIRLEITSSDEPTFQNLLCIERDGSLAWTAELPRSHDAFVKFELTSEGLFAWGWSGFRVKLDPATGKIIERKFVG